jgi:hypothetical protein
LYLMLIFIFQVPKGTVFPSMCSTCVFLPNFL